MRNDGVLATGVMSREFFKYSNIHGGVRANRWKRRDIPPLVSHREQGHGLYWFFSALKFYPAISQCSNHILKTTRQKQPGNPKHTFWEN